jgi:AAA domain
MAVNNEKKSKLKAVIPSSATPSKPKVLVFGRPGVGKTWWALDFPGVYYIDTEGGANRDQYIEKLQKSGGVYMGPEQDSQEFEKVIEELKNLATEEHPYKTVVIDSLSKLYNSTIAREMDRLGDKDAFGASKKPATALTRRLINWIDRIDMNVILIAHEKVMWEKSEQTGYTFDAWEKLEYELDLAIRVQKSGDKRVGNVKKSRLKNFPDGDNFSWNYLEFAKRYGQEIIEKAGQVIQLATNEQLGILSGLLQDNKISLETQEKWFSKEKVTDFREMPTHRVMHLIEHLQKLKEGALK